MSSGSGRVGHVLFGAIYFLPIYATVFIVGGFWEVLFATVRKHEINEGFLRDFDSVCLNRSALRRCGRLLCITFGVVVAKEVFGGTGKTL